MMIRLAVLATALLATALLADERQEIEKRVAEFTEAVSAGDAAAIAALYTEDGIVLPPAGEAAEGREAIYALWTGMFEAGLGRVERRLLDLEVSGNMAAEGGVYEAVFDAAEGARTVSGRYVVVWKRIDGLWFHHRSIRTEAAR